MTKSLRELLANKWDEPEEMKLIKDFVRQKFKAQVGVKLHEKTIVISTPNSALAGALRLEVHNLKNQLSTDKKLVIRIGN